MGHAGRPWRLLVPNSAGSIPATEASRAARTSGEGMNLVSLW
jgi:hypothetical protein